VLNTQRAQGTLGRVEAQEPRLDGPANRFGGGSNVKGNGTWVLACGNARVPSGWRKLRRGNPMSAAGMKQDWRGFEGSKPSRG